jgi:hypothetical protein
MVLPIGRVDMSGSTFSKAVASRQLVQCVSAKISECAISANFVQPKVVLFIVLSNWNLAWNSC